jgi:NAD(P)H dehydrogenase (quinone)
MKILVVIGHQRQGSFCHAIAAAAVQQLAEEGHDVVLHDLYAERFDPILTQEEIEADEPGCAVVKGHIRELLACDGIVVVHPNWWGQPPAILKGWIDRVFRQGAIYRFTESGPVGELAGKTALVLTTSNTPRDVELSAYGDPLENLWKNCIFGLCGISGDRFRRRNFESIVMSTPDERQAWLDEVRRLVQEQFPTRESRM